MTLQVRIAFILARCIAAAIAFHATDRHPYNFYIFTRWIIFLTCCWGIFFYRPRFWQFSFPFYAIVGIIFNPLIPFHFTRGTWHDLDIAAGLFLLATIPFSLQPENAQNKNLRDISPIPETPFIEQTAIDPIMNKKRIAKEWLYFLPCFIFGLFGFRFLIEIIFLYFNPERAINISEIYSDLFGTLSGNQHGVGWAWLTVLFPYLLFQFVRSVIWAWKTVFPKQPAQVQSAEVTMPSSKNRLLFLLSLLLILLLICVVGKPNLLSSQYKAESGERNLVPIGQIPASQIPKTADGVNQLISQYGKVPQGEVAFNSLGSNQKKDIFAGLLPSDNAQQSQPDQQPPKKDIFADLLPSTQASPSPVATPLPAQEQNKDPFADIPVLDSKSETTNSPSPVTVPQQTTNSAFLEQTTKPTSSFDWKNSKVIPLKVEVRKAIPVTDANSSQQSSTAFESTDELSDDLIAERKGAFTIGSTQKQVAAVMGAPTSLYDYPGINKSVWRYGESTVNFENGKVTGWDERLYTLKVWIKN